MAARLPPNQQLVAPDRWPVVGERVPRADDRSWTVTVCGLVAREATYSLEELRALAAVDQFVDVHCVTRWSRPRMRFRGVPLRTLLDAAEVQPEARFVSFVARSSRGHSTSLDSDYLAASDALVAFAAEGTALTAEHGGPVRMVVPGRYFYKSVKWLERIELLAEDRLGYWERDAGYHNVADPWAEQRFVAANVSKQLAAELIASRDFSGRDLMSIDASGRQLEGLLAAGALLRNADFRNAALRRADFRGANLSGARLGRADLRGAVFRDADVEGADFSGADVRGADFAGAALFGASFCVVAGEAVADPAVLDFETRIDSAGLDALTRDQRQFVVGRLQRSGG